MTPDWTPLEAELDRWVQTGLTLPLWWRDDDAVEPTPQLDRLYALSQDLGLPVHVAVIPEPAQPSLAAYMTARTTLIPLAHGWAHRNHQPGHVKRAEFGDGRPAGVALADATLGKARLDHLFGEELRPVFVPPWNRISDEVVAGLSALGFHILSTSEPRNTRDAAPGLEQVNTHLDVIDWRGTRSAVARQTLVARLTAHLADRREGRGDNDEPYGILTHHLVHDEAIWQVTHEILKRLMAGPVRPWIAPRNSEDTTI